MNNAIKAGLSSSQLRAAFFHSTPVLERRRRRSWDSRFTHHSKNFRRVHAKQTLLRNISAYAEHLFQSWKNENDIDDGYSSSGPSWFGKQYFRGSRKDRKGYRGPQDFWTDEEPHRGGRRGFQFCEDDFEYTASSRSKFGGSQFFYWSFIHDEDPYCWYSSRYSNRNRRFWNWRDRLRDDDDSSTDSDSSETDLIRERLALGLNTNGPLSRDDVKNAYRVCALKWHPDRHQGSEKTVAEEKFKLCSAAYQSLCDKLVQA